MESRSMLLAGWVLVLGLGLSSAHRPRHSAAPPNFHDFSPLTDSAYLHRLAETVSSPWAHSVECRACRAVVASLHFVWDSERSEACVASLVGLLCATLKLQQPQICQAISSQYRGEVLHVLGQLLISPDQICGILLSDCGDPFNPLDQNWNLTLPEGKPTPKPLPVPPTNLPSLRVLHLSDIHVDSAYLPGSEAACAEPLCCRNGSASVSVPAGFWGHVGYCDLPPHTLDDILRHIAQEEDIAYIVWTGDLAPHNVWATNKSRNVEELRWLSRTFQRHFPNTPVFSTVGNHESAPTDSFPSHSLAPLGSEYSTEWLYEALADAWGPWLPNSTQQTIKWRASYAVTVAPGLRLISINTQYCDSYNFWLYLNSTDPDGTLQWLVEELHKAEMAGDAVHIIGHIPPGDSCLRSWSRNYYRIVNRFESTIRAQFFGHTHHDSFSVFYDLSGKRRRPTNSMFVAPSVTTYSDLLPSYRIYTVDGLRKDSTWAVLDHETHFLNLTEANRLNKTVYQLEYRAKETYGLKSLSPKSLDRLISVFLRNETAFALYNRFYTRTNEPNCTDAKCRFDRLCEMRAARSGPTGPFCGDLPQPPSLQSASLSSAERRRRGEELSEHLDQLSWTQGHFARLASACLPHRRPSQGDQNSPTGLAAKLRTLAASLLAMFREYLSS